MIVSFMKKTMLFCAILAFSACHKKMTEPPVGQKNLPQTTAQPPVTAIDQKPEPADLRARVLASIKKTGCFGRCPVWSATVWSDGHAEYFGEKWARRDGHFTATLKKNWLKSLLETAESSGYFAFAPYYPIGHEEIPDLPTTFVFIESKGRFQQIEDHFDSPVALRNFESSFEEKLEELDWK